MADLIEIDGEPAIKIRIQNIHGNSIIAEETGNYSRKRTRKESQIDDEDHSYFQDPGTKRQKTGVFTRNNMDHNHNRIKV